jgi:hypothetical protein
MDQSNALVRIPEDIEHRRGSDEPSSCGVITGEGIADESAIVPGLFPDCGKGRPIRRMVVSVVPLHHGVAFSPTHWKPPLRENRTVGAMAVWFP